MRVDQQTNMHTPEGKSNVETPRIKQEIILHCRSLIFCTFKTALIALFLFSSGDGLVISVIMIHSI